MKWKVTLVRWPNETPETEVLMLDSFEEAAYLIEKTYERDADLHHVYVMRVPDDHKLLDGEELQK